ncbi:hypothetical protein LDENG_00165280 [Lucifuga dentata]|nr:hypothetical protein LDENG_00165280 [Lucifuga dentata]
MTMKNQGGRNTVENQKTHRPNLTSTWTSKKSQEANFWKKLCKADRLTGFKMPFLPFLHFVFCNFCLKCSRKGIYLLIILQPRYQSTIQQHVWDSEIWKEVCFTFF